MARIIIICANGLLTFLVFVGLPAASRADLGNLQLSHANTGRLLMFWGLGLAAGLNAIAAHFWIKNGKSKLVCWEWTGLFAGFWLAFLAHTKGYFNFVWLHKILIWLNQHL